MWANYCALLWVYAVLCPVLKNRKKKSEHPCLYLRNSSSDARWLLEIPAGGTRLLLLQFANRESVQSHCVVIFVHQQVFGWNKFSSDFEGYKSWTERSSSAAVWNVEGTDVCESTAHSSPLVDIPRSQPLALNWRPTFPLPDSRGSESAECEFCFCVPCVTTSCQTCLGTGQSAHRRNSGIRKKMYKRFWSMLEMRNS